MQPPNQPWEPPCSNPMPPPEPIREPPPETIREPSPLREPPPNGDTQAHRRRGPAKCIEFEKLWKYGPVILKINDCETAPCCSNAAMFTARVTQIIKQHCDMSYTRWTNVLQAQKDELIDRVRGDFALDWDRENHRLTVRKQLRKLFNAFHHELHKKYESYGSHEEALAAGSTMVDFEEFKRIARQNRENRKALTINHTAGRKSFVRLVEEKRATTTNLVEFYKESHWSKKNGKFVTSVTENTYNEMVSKMDGLEPEQRNDEAASIVFREVLGHRPGYARGLGEMVIPESTRQRNTQKEREYLALIEKHKTDAENYKTKLDQVMCEMQALRERQNATDQMLQSFFQNFHGNTESLQSCGET
ncbi:hypothetical protein I3842_01G058900 [Carya illinoinensis]|uniref:Uncharacterized protein n=1 Tax=Carya illinoinensis TaxID=32201 RepID=A0A922FX20_CARIL|nr:hypothetical protein I3842_01G058900 [Carya illinoinensis]